MYLLAHSLHFISVCLAGAVRSSAGQIQLNGTLHEEATTTNATTAATTNGTTKNTKDDSPVRSGQVDF